MIIESKDGKIERVEGKEPLIKEPSKKNLLKDRWKNIKKNLDNNDSILDLSSLSTQDDSNDQPEKSDKQQEEAPQNSSQVNDAPSDEDNKEQPNDDASAPKEQITDLQHDLHYENEIKHSLKEHGYSDVEIAYILHGHDFTMHGLEGQEDGEENNDDEFDNEDPSNSQQDSDSESEEPNYKSEHEKRMLDLEYNHKQRQLQLEMHLKEQEIQHKLEKLKNQNK